MKKAIKSKKKEEKGAVLPVALLVIVTMLILSLPFLSRLSGQFRVTEKSYKSLAALNLAEAGAERAIWEFNHGYMYTWDGDENLRTMNISSFEASGGSVIGDIQVSVSDPEGLSPIVEAIGRVPFTGDQTVEKTVRVVLEKELESYFNHSFFAHSGIEMAGNARMDSYDSDLGPYDQQNPSSVGTIATNSTAGKSITLKNNIEINGGVICGPGGDPEEVIELKNNAEINGDTDTLSMEKQLPSVPAPEGLLYMEDYDSNQDPLLITESVEYHNFQVKTGDTVTISGGTEEEPITVYVNHDFSMDRNAALEIAENSVVELIIGHKYDQNQNSSVNNLSQDTKSLVILATDSCDQVRFRSNQDFWGSIYAPRAEVEFEASGDFYGSLVADYIKLNSNVGLHYDESLADWMRYSTGTGNVSVKSWKEKIQ